MKHLLIAILLFFPCFVRADDKSRHDAAVALIDLINGKDVARASFVSTIDGYLDNLSKSGKPPAEVAEVRQAMIDWYDKNIIWDEIREKMVVLYVNQFSEDELKQIYAFYQTPAGKKTLERLPIIMQQATLIGQDYAKSKQDLLSQRLQEIDKKYQAASTPAAPTSPATAPAR